VELVTAAKAIASNASSSTGIKPSEFTLNAIR
jgi:hypothetical protein